MTKPTNKYSKKHETSHGRQKHGAVWQTPTVPIDTAFEHLLQTVRMPFFALLLVIRKIHRQDSFRTKQNTQQTFTHINLYSPQSKQCEKVARARVHANVMRSTGTFDSKWCANVNICARTQHGAHISWQLHIQMMS